MARGAPIGNLPANIDLPDLIERLNGMLQTIELRLQSIEQVFTDEAYATTNVTPDRDFDADTVAVAELADVVGTLIQDLQTAGRIP